MKASSSLIERFLASAEAGPHIRTVILTRSREEYDDRLNAFFWDLPYVAKSLRRGDLYHAKYMLDSVIRFPSQQRFVEWFIGCRHGWKVGTNQGGRWFRRYLDKPTWALIESTFAGADIPADWQALFRSVEVARHLCKPVARERGYAYPREQEEEVTAFLRRIRES